MTEVKYASDFVFTKDTQFRTLTGDLWGVFREDLSENWPRYNSIAQYK